MQPLGTLLIRQIFFRCRLCDKLFRGRMDKEKFHLPVTKAEHNTSWIYRRFGAFALQETLWFESERVQVVNGIVTEQPVLRYVYEKNHPFVYLGDIPGIVHHRRSLGYGVPSVCIVFPRNVWYAYSHRFCHYETEYRKAEADP